jgi:hypothetical protein
MVDETAKSGRRGFRIDDGELEYEILSQIGARMDERFSAVTPPETLHHYTTLGGLKGILASRTMWATNAEFMNDSQEVQYPYYLFGDRARQMSTRLRKGETVRGVFLEACIESLKIAGGAESAYVSCFCERADLLSQWRGYSDSAGGYALELETQFLKREGFMFGKVIYDPKVQKEQIDYLLECGMDEAVRRTESLKGAKLDKALNDVVLAFGTLQWMAFVTFKDKAFEEEQEWRLTRIMRDGRPNLPLHFRQGGSVLIPYLEVPLEAPGQPYENGIPMRSIMVGPMGHPELARHSLRMFLRSVGSKAEVKRSTVSLRSRP